MSGAVVIGLVVVGGVCMVLFLWWGTQGDPDDRADDSFSVLVGAGRASLTDPDRGIEDPLAVDVARYEAMERRLHDDPAREDG